MLTHLRISNLGVIAEATLAPHPGMTVVTGETGAGKTMIVTGLGMLLGSRSDSGVVRHGSDRCLVEGRFCQLAAVADALDEVGAEVDDDELLAARQVQVSGRSRAMLGGVQVPLARLNDVVGELATIHGQSEQVRLGSPDRQREVLDRSGGASLAEALETYRARYLRRRALREELDTLQRQARERAREHDLLEFGLNEIAEVDPQPGEDDELAAEANRLQAVDDLRLLAERASHSLSGDSDGNLEDPGAVGLVGMARKDVDRVAELDPRAGEVAQQIREVGFRLNDAAAQVARYLADLEADPGRLEWVAARRSALQGLTRKYGATVTEVLDWARLSAARLAELSGDDDRISIIETELADLELAVRASGLVLTDLRGAAATALSASVIDELAALAMPHARLAFVLKPLLEPGPWGMEQVSLVFAANPGAEPAPLAKVASGGELSRLRLGLEVVLAETDPGHTFVFDEVDAGVGGAVGLEIGRRLAKLATASQVIVVTHLAQVAAFADRHCVVTKSDDGEVTVADLREVTGDSRVAEVARMMGGLTGSHPGLAHARELLASAGQLESAS